MSYSDASHFSHSVLSERPSVTNAARLSSSLPSTTFAAPAVVRFHPPPFVHPTSPAVTHSEATSPARLGKENARGRAGELRSSPDVASPKKPSLQVMLHSGSPAPALPSSPPPHPPAPAVSRESAAGGADEDAGRLSFARPTERVLHIHSISDRESLARLSVGPSHSAHPAPSFRYSLRSSYRPYQWTAARGGVGGKPTASHRGSTLLSDDGQQPSQSLEPAFSTTDSASAPSSPPPARSVSPPLHTPDSSSLHRRQPSARKERTTAASAHESRPQPAFVTNSSQASSPSSSRPLPHISTTPLIPFSRPSSSFSTLPHSPSRTATARTSQHQPREEERNEGGWTQPPSIEHAASLGAASASSSLRSALDWTSADSSGEFPSFRAFVSSSAYASYESEVVNNVDLLRRSNALNEDTADYALILQPDIVAHTHAHIVMTCTAQWTCTLCRSRCVSMFPLYQACDDVDVDAAEADAEKEEVEMYIRQAERASSNGRSRALSPTAALRTPERGTWRREEREASSPRSPASGPVRKRSNPLPPLPTLLFSDLSRRFSSRSRLEPGRPNSAVLIERLRGAGLEVRVDSLRLGGKVLLRVSACAERLEEEAEKMKMKLRVKQGGWRKFDRSIREHFTGSGDSVELFRSCERQTIIDHIIRTKQADGGAGLDDQYSSLIAERFPLHMHARLLSLQPWLSFWTLHSPSAPSSCCAWLQPLLRVFRQPLSSVSAYYGEGVAFYFAFLGFYTAWLCVPTVFGLGLFLSQLSHTSLDSPLVPFFCLLMALWASVFIEQWRRREAVLANGWGVWQMNDNDEELTRPEYRGQMQRHEVTGEIIRIYPLRKRIRKLCLAFLLCFVLVAAFSTLILNIFMQQDKYFGNVTGSESSASSFFSLDMLFVPVVWGFLIPVSELLFNRVAEKVTNWENWRTPSVYQNQLIVKIFSFRFLNSFLALYYYAFADLGILRLTTSVASFLLVGSAFRFFIYTSCPAIHRRIIDRLTQRRAKAAIELQQLQASARTPHSRPLSLSSGWQESAHLSYDTFEDYCSLVIQFGYVSFFTVAFPLAPLCALLSNIIEIRAGAYKLLRVYRRPLAIRAPGIGVWLSVLQVMSVIAVLTNCALIGFTSRQVDNWVPNVSPALKIVVIFVFEHVVIAGKFIIHSYLFSVPRSVLLDRQREAFDNERMHRAWMEVKRKEKQQMQLTQAEQDANKLDMGE